MKENSIERWKSAVMTMPDSSFFELLRTVFGKIKTPFNKQQLIKDLEKFLLRTDIQKTIEVFIDNADAKIIAAVALFGEPAPEELERFFADEFSSVQLHDIIVNLEERFILYRFKDDNKSANNQKNGQFRIALNPVLEKVLAPVAADTSVLFQAVSSSAKTKQAKTAAVLNDRILAGLLSFVSQYEDTAFYKRERQLRKQILDAGKKCFPCINLEETLGSLQVLGLFFADGENLYSDKKRFSDIAILSARERMEYCAASFLVYKEAGCPNDIQAPYYKNRIKEAVNFIHLLMDSLILIYPANLSITANQYPEKTAIKLAEVFKSRMQSAVNIGLLINAMEKAGLLTLPDSKKENVQAITIDSGFSVFMYPEINFADAAELAVFLNIKETGAVVRFELEKSSAVRAFNNGISAQTIIDLLSRLSDKKLPDTLAWNLKDWEKRHGEVALKRGVVLTLAKDKQYLAQTAPLSALITDTLAQGVYLLNENAEEQAAAALHSAGVDIIKRAKQVSNTNQVSGANKNTARTIAHAQSYFPACQSTAKQLLTTPSVGFKKEKPGTKSAEKTFDQLSGRAILEKMTLSKADRDELSARIDRRLILCEAQLKDANIRYEKLEARHMDYAGKQNIAKQAIAQGSPVEVMYPAGNIYGIPSALEKEGAELFLIITPAGKDNEVRIPLAKISLLRRIKKSVFEG